MWFNSPFNYTGNKFKQLEQLNSLLPIDTNNMMLVDLFSGSGTVGMNFSEKFNCVVCNDNVKDLITLHIWLYNNSNNVEYVYNILTTYSSNDPIKYSILRKEYNECIDNIERGFRLYGLILSCTNNFMRFNKEFKFNQTCGKRQFNDSVKAKLSIWLENIKNIQNVKFTCGDFSKIKTTENMLIYCDPPYSNTEAGYNTLWKRDDDIRLYNYIMNNKCKYMISSSISHGGTRSLLVDKLIETGLFTIHDIEYNYNKVAKNKKETHEVVLTNY